MKLPAKFKIGDEVFVEFINPIFCRCIIEEVDFSISKVFYGICILEKNKHYHWVQKFHLSRVSSDMVLPLKKVKLKTK